MIPKHRHLRKIFEIRLFFFMINLIAFLLFLKFSHIYSSIPNGIVTIIYGVVLYRGNKKDII